jgi:hypothetical protein
MAAGSRGRRERGSARVRRRLRVTLRQGPCFTVDVSAGGFCTELLRALPPGTPVEGKIQVRGADVPFTGRVVWARPGDPYLGLRARMGVLFTRLAPGFPDLTAKERGDAG